MAHYAQITNDTVTEVIVAEQTFIDTLENKESWVQTSYNTHGGVHALGGIPFRKNYAGIGYTYDAVRDAFIPPQPYPSWTLNEDTCLWEPPVPYPTDGNQYTWNETLGNWEQT